MKFQQLEPEKKTKVIVEIDAELKDAWFDSMYNCWRGKVYNDQRRLPYKSPVPDGHYGQTGTVQFEDEDAGIVITTEGNFLLYPKDAA